MFTPTQERLLTLDHKLVYDPFMPHVSRNKLDQKIEKQLTDTLDIVLTNLSKQDEVKGFLLSLLTPTERIMLAKRLTIIILLNEGFSESEIADTLHVTRVTVSRMQLFYEARGEGYAPALKILQNEKIVQELKTAFIKVLRYSVRAAGGRVKPGIF